jgi:hypothetical protein
MSSNPFRSKPASRALPSYTTFDCVTRLDPVVMRHSREVRRGSHPPRPTALTNLAPSVQPAKSATDVRFFRLAATPQFGSDFMTTINLARQVMGPKRRPMVNSWDVFDTLITRFHLDPTDIFRLIDQRAGIGVFRAAPPGAGRSRSYRETVCRSRHLSPDGVRRHGTSACDEPSGAGTQR